MQKFNFNKIEKHYKQVLQYAPGMLGNEAVNFFTDSFKRQGWLGARLEPWRKRRTEGKRKGRATLIDTGRLRRGIRITSNTGGVVTIGNNVPYAKAHNEGFKGKVNVQAHTRNKYTKSRVPTGKLTKKGKQRTKTVTSISGSTTVKAHTRNIRLPKRQFMGSSPYLTIKLTRILQSEINKGLR